MPLYAPTVLGVYSTHLFFVAFDDRKYVWYNDLGLIQGHPKEYDDFDLA
jgi:hypothetical protein